ncbi:MAG: c-type cytochrome [Sideroxydans sp.]|nr:c-type cytochrome [Sideroxydans sp.]
MKVQHVLMLTAGLLLSNVALADDGAALMKKNNCGTCHQAEKKTVGPGIKMIADKYRGDATAADKVAAKVRKGGSGVFGSMAMPATPAKVSDDDIKAMVAYILK